MTTHRSIILFVLSLLLTGTVFAQPTVPPASGSPNAQAESLNERGKELAKVGDYPGAINQFQQAIAINPDGRYFFNLCVIYYRQGNFGEARVACQEAQRSNAPQTTKDKATSVLAKIDELAPEPTPTTPDPQPNPTEPGTGPTPVQPPVTTSQPPTQPVNHQLGAKPVVGDTEETSYNWSVGGEIGFVGRNYGEDNDIFAKGGFTVGGYLDYLAFKNARVGFRTFLSVSNFAANDGLEAPLNIVDLGIGLYRHIDLGGLRITPRAMIGVGFPVDEVESATTAMMRFDASISWPMGHNKMHEFSITPLVNYYLGAVDSNTNYEEGGSNIGITVGYTIRFTSPFGPGAIFRLE